MRPVRKADNLPPSYGVVTKSGKLNFLEPSGHFRASKRTDFTYSRATGSVTVNTAELSGTYVCMYVCMCVCVYVYVYICMYVCYQV